MEPKREKIHAKRIDKGSVFSGWGKKSENLGTDSDALDRVCRSGTFDKSALDRLSASAMMSEKY